MTFRLLITLLLICISNSVLLSQEIDYEIDVWNLHVDPNDPQLLRQLLWSDAQAWLNHRIPSQGDNATLHLFDGNQLDTVLNLDANLVIHHATSNGVFAGIDRYITFISLSGQIDTLSSEPFPSYTTYFHQNYLYVFSPTRGVWRFDEAGNELILNADYNQAFCFSGSPFFVFGDLLVYCNGVGYSITDGTPAGTRTVFERAGQLLIHDNKLINFNIDDNQVYDPQQDYVYPLLEDSEISISSSQVLSTTNGLLFLGRTADSGDELYLTNGSLTEASILLELTPGQASGVSRSSVIALNKHIIFRRNNSGENNEIWISNGTLEGTHMIYDAASDISSDLSWFISAKSLSDSTMIMALNSSSTNTTTLIGLNTETITPIANKIRTWSSSIVQLEELSVLKNRLLIGGDWQQDSLFSIGPKEEDSVFLGQIKQNSILYVSDDFAIMRSASSDTNHPRGLAYTRGRQNDLTSLPLSTVSGGPPEDETIFPLGDELYLFSKDNTIGQSIHRLDFRRTTMPLEVDLFADEEGVLIGSILAMDKDFLWRASYDFRSFHYYSEDTPESTSIVESANWRSDDVLLTPIGSTSNRFYWSNRLLDNKLYEFDRQRQLQRELQDSILIENSTRSNFGSPVIIGEKLYMVRYYTLNDQEGFKQELIEYDPVTNEKAIIESSIVNNRNVDYCIDVVSDGSNVFYTYFEDEQIKLALYNPSSETKTTLSDNELSGEVHLIDLSSHLVISYEINRQEEYRLLDVSGLGTVLFDLTGDSNLGLTDYILTITDGKLYSQNVKNRDANFLADLGNDPLPLYPFSTQQALFVAGTQEDGWELWITDGTPTGTKFLFQPHTVSRNSPWFAVVSGYILFYGENEKLFVYDVLQNRLEQININNRYSFPSPRFGVIENRAYVQGYDPLVGNELHEITFPLPSTLKGTTYLDDNNNGRYDEEEMLVSGVPILIEPVTSAPNTVFSNQFGTFSFAVDIDDNYTISPMLTGTCYDLTSSPTSYQVSYHPDSTYQFSFGLGRRTNEVNIQSLIVSQPFICGSNIPLSINILNNGCQSTDGVLKLTLPIGVELISASIPPAIEEDTLIWSLPVIITGQDISIQLELSTTDNTFNSDQLLLTYQATGADTIISSYSYTLPNCTLLSNSKVVFPNRKDDDNNNYTQSDERLIYTIRFQNTTLDTIHNVRIEDYLDRELDYSTIHPLNSSHNFHLTLEEEGKLTFYFDEINLPCSRISERNSHGFVSFSVKPRAEIINLTTVDNQAGIFFDFNAPIITNTVTSTIVEALDADGDGFYFYDDCNDTNADINPMADEVPGNGIDENCDGQDVIVNLSELTSPQLKVFPNPTHHQVYLRCDVEKSIDGMLYNSHGQLVQRFNFKQSHRLDLARFPAGIYTVALLIEGENSLMTSRIVKR